MLDFRRVLAYYPTDCQPMSVESLGNAGGLSGAEFWRLATPRGLLMLRCWPAEHPSADGLRFIHAVLRHAAERGIGILPVPLVTTAGATFVHDGGGLWELTPWLTGIADYERCPSTEKLRAAMQALAQFHIAVSSFPTQPPRAPLHRPPPATTRHLARLRSLASGGMDTLVDSVTNAEWPELAVLARQFLASLPRAVPLAIERLVPLADVALPLQVCIRDIWHDHVLFDGARVTGLVDFGATQIDTPATDVARLLGSLVGTDPAGRQTGLAAYSAVRPISTEESVAVFALHASGTILALCNWIRWIYIDERRFARRSQVVTRFAALLKNLPTI